jgi:hypothetical protein
MLLVQREQILRDQRPCLKNYNEDSKRPGDSLGQEKNIRK